MGKKVLEKEKMKDLKKKKKIWKTERKMFAKIK